MTGPVTTEALVAELAEAMLRHEWPNSPLVPFAEQDERIRNYWLGHAKAQIAGPLAPLLAALQQVTAERDEADRRAGAAEREAERDREDARKRSAWLHQAKQQAGYSTNVSFDKVWAETLEKAARADAATSELARLRAEGEAKDRRIAALTEALAPFARFADMATPDAAETWAGVHHSFRIGTRFKHEHFRAARAATAREG